MLNYSAEFKIIRNHCITGKSPDIDSVMSRLNCADLPTTRAVDFYLGMVEEPEGVERITYYLFNGTQIQRNYSTLYMARRNEWGKVNKAYELGLIDAIQAYSR